MVLPTRQLDGIGCYAAATKTNAGLINYCPRWRIDAIDDDTSYFTVNFSGNKENARSIYFGQHFLDLFPCTHAIILMTRRHS